MMVDWRTLPSLVSLRAFDAVARHGGFTGAARALNVTHPAIAQQVRALEREMGMALVQRLGRAVSLTAEGERLARLLEEGFGSIASGITRLRRDDKVRGLRVATSTFIGQTVILPRLPEFWARHPGIEVTMTPVGTEVDLRADGFDLAIAGCGGDDPGVQRELLVRSRWLLAGAPALLGDGAVDVASLPWLFPGVVDDELLARVGTRIDPSKGVNVGSPHLEIAAAVLGMGLIFATEIVIRAELASGQLREVPFEGLPEANYYVTVPSGPRRTATTAFVDWVKTLV